MSKVNLLVVAVLATGLLWCLDQAVGSADASGECSCQTILVYGQIDPNGMYKTTLPPDAVPAETDLPLVQVYQRTGELSWETVYFEAYHGDGGIIVRGEPGAEIVVVALRLH